MPKMKTKRAAAKRFSVTATGKVKFKKKGLKHILTKHTTKSKRNKRSPGYLEGQDNTNARKLIPYL